MKQNITLSLDKDLIRKAKIIAVQRDTSVSGLLSQELSRIVASAERYERAKQKALSSLAEGFHLGGQRPGPREDLHDRAHLR